MQTWNLVLQIITHSQMEIMFVLTPHQTQVAVPMEVILAIMQIPVDIIPAGVQKNAKVIF